MISSAEKFKPSERKCIATGQVLSKSELVRFVLGPNSLIYPDPENKLPGRGIWVKADRSAIMKAEKGKLFSLAAKQSVECLENLAEQKKGDTMENDNKTEENVYPSTHWTIWVLGLISVAALIAFVMHLKI